MFYACFSNKEKQETPWQSNVKLYKSYNEVECFFWIKLNVSAKFLCPIINVILFIFNFGFNFFRDFYVNTIQISINFYFLFFFILPE